jgi:hypothetical protein
MIDAPAPFSELPPKRSARVSNFTFFFFVVLTAVAVYLPSLRAEFLVLDDPQYITRNPYVLYPSGSKLAAFFTEVFHPSTVEGYSSH